MRCHLHLTQEEQVVLVGRNLVSKSRPGLEELFVGDRDGALRAFAFGAEQAGLDQPVREWAKIVSESIEKGPTPGGQAFRVDHQERLEEPWQQLIYRRADLPADVLLHRLDLMRNGTGDAAETVIGLLAQRDALAFFEKSLQDKGEERQAARFRACLTGKAPHQAVGDLKPGALGWLPDHVDHDGGLDVAEWVMAGAAKYLKQVRMAMAMMETVAAYGGDDPQRLALNRSVKGGEKGVGLRWRVAGEKFLHLVQEQQQRWAPGALRRDMFDASLQVGGVLDQLLADGVRVKPRLFGVRVQRPHQCVERMPSMAWHHANAQAAPPTWKAAFLKARQHTRVQKRRLPHAGIAADQDESSLAGV